MPEYPGFLNAMWALTKNTPWLIGSVYVSTAKNLIQGALNIYMENLDDAQRITNEFIARLEKEGSK